MKLIQRWINLNNKYKISAVEKCFFVTLAYRDIEKLGSILITWKNHDFNILHHFVTSLLCYFLVYIFALKKYNKKSKLKLHLKDVHRLSDKSSTWQ